jgi:hypothetical protein
MALAGGLFARSHVARDSGASGHFCASRARLVRTVDDSAFLPRGATRIPCVDDARVVVRLCDRLGALLCTNSTAVEPLNTGSRNRLGVDSSSQQLISSEICWLLDEGFRGSFRFAKGFAVRTSAPAAINSIVDNKAPTYAAKPQFDKIALG